MNIWLLIASCSVATLLPRTAPYFMPFLAKLPRFLRKCMILLPVAALGALIFPLALTDFHSEWYAGLVGVVSAFLVSYFKAPMIASILVSLTLTALCLLI